MIVATAGHVDHGKTTLIRTLTGVDTDRLAIEKQRGLSIELGFAYWNAVSGERYGFIDVPGHARFLPTMAAGVGGIDAALLVVAADDGVMPQTREHLDVLDFLGVSQGVVALSKGDLVPEDRIDSVISDIEAALAGSGLAGADIIPVDSLSGRGFDNLRTALSTLQPKARQTEAPARLSIDRSFILKGVGLVVTGTLLSGKIAIGDTLTVSPAGLDARVRGLHAQDEKVEAAQAGQRCAVNLTGPDIDTDTVRRGYWLVANGGASRTTRIDTEIRLGEDSPILKRRDLPVTLHIGAAKTVARLVLLDSKTLGPGETALAQLITDEPVDAVFNDRFVLRDHAGARTIAGGRVITPFGAARGRAKPDRLQQLAARRKDKALDALRALLGIPPFHVDMTAFCAERNLLPSASRELIESAGAIGITHDGKQHAINTEYWDRWKDCIAGTISAYHERHPHLPGCTEADFRKTFPGDGPGRDLLKVLLGNLRDTGIIGYRNGVYCLPGFSPSLTKEDEVIWRQAEARFEQAGPQAPTVHELAKELAIEPEKLGTVLDRAAALGSIVHISRNRYLLPKTVTDFEKVASSLGEEYSEGFPVTAFRDQAGIGRNLAIDALEYFDRQGFTTRHGNLRTTR